jgi:hypothetical protein
MILRWKNKLAIMKMKERRNGPRYVELKSTARWSSDKVCIQFGKTPDSRSGIQSLLHRTKVPPVTALPSYPEPFPMVSGP